MGQRNASYIMVENKATKEKKITQIYNQWNFIAVQPLKMVRGIEGVLEDLMDEDLGYVYFKTAGESPDVGWVGGRIEPLHKPFNEDNNNGWNLVKFVVDGEKCDVEFFCIAGSEDGNFDVDYTFDEYWELDSEKNMEAIETLRNLGTWNPQLRCEIPQFINSLIENEAN